MPSTQIPRPSCVDVESGADHPIVASTSPKPSREVKRSVGFRLVQLFTILLTILYHYGSFHSTYEVGGAETFHGIAASASGASSLSRGARIDGGDESVAQFSNAANDLRSPDEGGPSVDPRGAKPPEWRNGESEEGKQQYGDADEEAPPAWNAMEVGEERTEGAPPPVANTSDLEMAEREVLPPATGSGTTLNETMQQPTPTAAAQPAPKNASAPTVASGVGVLPFCSTDFDPAKKIHTAYADGDWVVEDASAPGAQCTVSEDPKDEDKDHTICTAPESWKVHKGSVREAAGWIGCPEPLVRECSDKDLSEEARVLEAMRWQWKPKGCRLHDFTPRAFLDALGDDNNIFMVGDSLTADQGEALQCVLPPGQGRRVSIQRRDYLGASGAPGGGDSQTLKEALTGPDGPAKENELVAHLTTRWRATFADEGRRPHAPEGTENDVLQFNAGAHWTLDPADASPVFRAVARAIKASFRGLVLFRTNVMGHNKCHRFTDPFKTAAEARETAVKYNWADFRAYNAAIYEAFREVGVPDFRVVDVSMFERRGDGHVTFGDCLHYCKPGHPDFWNKKVLFHIMAEHRRAKKRRPP